MTHRLIFLHLSFQRIKQEKRENIIQYSKKNLKEERDNILKFPRHILFCLLLCSLFKVSVSADLPSVRIKKAEAPVLDGVLSEGCWKKATPLENFTLDFPREPSDIQTKVFLSCDGKNLYIAVEASDPNPEKIKADVSDFDNRKIFSDDSVEIFIAPETDPKRYFQIVVNPEGFYTDCLHVIGASRSDFSWNSCAETASERNKNGWILEMAVPLKNTGLAGRVLSAWRFNVVRNIPKRKDTGAHCSQWAYTGGNGNKPWLFGVVSGTEKIREIPGIWEQVNPSFHRTGMAAVVKGMDCFLRACLAYKGFLPENAEIDGSIDDCRNMALAQHPSKADGYLRFYMKTGLEEYREMTDAILTKLYRMMEKTKDKDGKPWLHWGRVVYKNGKAYGYSQGPRFGIRKGILPHKFDQSRAVFPVKSQGYVDAFGLGFYGISCVRDGMSPEIQEKVLSILETTLDFYHRDYVLKDEGGVYYWRTDNFKPLKPKMPIPPPLWRRLGTDIVYLIMACDNMNGEHADRYIKSLEKFCRFYMNGRMKLNDRVKDASPEKRRRALWRMNYLDSRMLDVARHLSEKHEDDILLSWIHDNLKKLPRYTTLPGVEFMLDGEMQWGDSTIPLLKMYAELNPPLYKKFLHEIVSCNLFPRGICTSGYIAEPVNESAFPPLLDFGYEGWKKGALEGKAFNDLVWKTYSILGHPALVRDTEDWVRDVHPEDRLDPDWRATPCHAYLENILGEGFYRNASTQAYMLNWGYPPKEKYTYYSDKRKFRAKNVYYQYTAPFQNHAEPFHYGRAHAFNLINTKEANSRLEKNFTGEAEPPVPSETDLTIHLPALPRGMPCYGVLDVSPLLYIGKDHTRPSGGEIRSIESGDNAVDFELYEMLEYRKRDSSEDKAIVVFFLRAEGDRSTAPLTLRTERKTTTYFRK